MATKWEPITADSFVDFAVHKRVSRANPPPTVRVHVRDSIEALRLNLQRDPTVAEIACRMVRMAALRMKLGHFPAPMDSRVILPRDLVIWGWDA